MVIYQNDLSTLNIEEKVDKGIILVIVYYFDIFMILYE